MGVIAVAGGTGGMGEAIVEQLQLTKRYPFIILSRKNNESSFHPPLVQVDYEDVESLVKVLDSHNIETIVSAISMHSEPSLKSQLNLIDAAEASKTTRRFIPSEFGVLNRPEDGRDETFPTPWIKTAERLKSSRLQYTRFVNGYLMDYWGMPHFPSHMLPGLWSIDVCNRRAVIAGSGNDIISLTHSNDVARFIVRSLESEDWPEYSIVVGSDVTLNEALAKIQNVRGGIFNVTYDSEEKLRNNDATLLEELEGDAALRMKQMTSFFGRLIICHRMEMPKERRMNDRYPDIHPVSIEEMIDKAWMGR
ncbi:Oxidoreductase BOA1 [Colletotrichum fructicola Nara gc5]|uniref:Oxidoreductase BOA1 n=1 Tax=Colletotrichum fructicola (strain Nara gc5) TaxID=1213859 RepID=A0A7J6JBE3_COLFN|nr:Oxidoreductase BOA1 [Colletotrichum fructicola Nara gc5]